jgi:2-deoxystreptamine N-acetyl-D-glucosaminyltransferase/2-deoxystreptamine glucosyltransferase
MLRVLRLCSVFEPRELTPGSVSYDPIGGMQNHVAELTRCLDRLGVSQLVVTSRLAGPADRVEFGAHGQVIRTGLPVPVLRQAWAPLAAPHALGGRRVDLIHVHCGEDLAALPLARIAARRHGSPVVVTLHLSVRHTLRPTTPRSHVLRAVGGMAQRWLLPGVEAVIALTPSAARLLRRDGIPADRVHVIPPGYHPALFAETPADPFPGLPRPRVAYVGRLAPQKDVGTLLEAFGQVAAGPQLVVVGDGPDRPALQRRAQPFGGRVHFTGFMPHVQIPAVLRHVDMLVLPSLYEDLSSVLIEAMAAGLPVVATRVGGTADLVNDGVNGVLIAPRDPAALAIAISRVLADPAAAARMASAARHTAAAYAWPDLAGNVLEVYRRVTASGDGGAAGGLPGSCDHASASNSAWRNQSPAARVTTVRSAPCAAIRARWPATAAGPPVTTAPAASEVRLSSAHPVRRAA